MRTLTSLMIAMAVGASAPAAAQTAPDVEAELDAELDRAAPPTEGEAAADDVDEKKEKEKKKRTERVVETTTEYDTEDLVLPSAEELFSTGGEIDEDDDDEPRAPRAVVRERVVERPVEPDPPEERVERDDEGPKVVAGDEEARSSLGRWIELEGEGPGEARAGAARVVPPAVSVEARDDMGSEPIGEPVQADRQLSADPDIGQPIEPAAMSDMVDTELRNIASRRLEYIGSLRSQLDESLQELTVGSQPSDLEERRVQIARLQEELAQMNTEAENIGIALERVGPSAVPAEVGALRDRIARGQDRLAAMREASSPDVFRSALEDFRNAVGEIERARVALEQRSF